MLFEPSVSCFSETQLFLDYAEYVLHFRTNRGLSVFCFLCSILAAFAQLLNLGWTAIDPVFDFVSSFVANDRIITFLRTEITAVTVNSLVEL